MTVTLTIADLILPDGELDNTYFPNGDLDVQIDGWLSKATSRVEANSYIAASSHNDAAEAWVYYMAYGHIANRIAAMPNTVSVGSGEVVRTYAQDRPAYWRSLALAKRTAYDVLVVIVPSVATGSVMPSSSVRLRAVW